MMDIDQLLPRHWNSTSNRNNSYELFVVNKNTDEYQQIRKLFETNKIKNGKVIELYRIQNKYAYAAAMIEKDKYIFQNKRSPNVSIVNI